MKCFEEGIYFTDITISLNETRVIYGNKLFNNQPHFNQLFYLPENIKLINKNKVEKLTSLHIPSHVISIRVVPRHQKWCQPPPFFWHHFFQNFYEFFTIIYSKFTIKL